METLDQMMERLKREKQQMYGGGNTPSTPSVDTNVDTLEQSQIMKTDKPEAGILEKIATVPMGIGSGLIKGSANLAGYGLDIASGLGQDIKENLQGDFGVGDTLGAILGNRKSDLGNAARNIGSAIADNPYGKMGLDESAFGAGQSIGEFGVGLAGANKLGLLEGMGKATGVGQIASGIAKLGARGVATSDIISQATKGEGATASERLLGGGLNVGLGLGQAALGTQFAKDVIIPKWLGGTGKGFREYLANTLKPQSVEEANKLILKAIPQLSSESAKNMGRTSVLIDDEMQALKKGGEYLSEGMKVSPREAFGIATDKTLTKLDVVKDQMLAKGKDLSFAEYASKSGLIDTVKELSALKNVGQLDDMLGRLLSKGKVSGKEFEIGRRELQNVINGMSDTLLPEQQALLREYTAGVANRYIDSKIGAGGAYEALKKDMSNLQGIQSVMSKDNVIKSAMTGEDAMSTASISGDAYDKAQGIMGAISGAVGGTVQGFRTAATAFLRNNLKLANKFSKNPDELFEAAYDYFKTNRIPVTQLEQYETRKIIEQKALRILNEQKRQAKELEQAAKKSQEAMKQAERQKGLQIADELFKKKQFKEASEVTAKQLNKSIVESITPSVVRQLQKAGETAKETRLRLGREAINKIK